MHCNKYKNIYHEYVSGKLNELESHAVAKHLKSCDKCRREVEEIRELRTILRDGFHEGIAAPAGLKSDIMALIDLKKYKNIHKNNLGEMASWGMSLVAAGLILLFINMTPQDRIARVQYKWGARSGHIVQKIYRPFDSINGGLEKLTDGIVQLDGITGRLEKGREGGNQNEL